MALLMSLAVMSGTQLSMVSIGHVVRKKSSFTSSLKYADSAEIILIKRLDDVS
jgi:hypothetical protein